MKEVIQNEQIRFILGMQSWFIFKNQYQSPCQQNKEEKQYEQRYLQKKH